MISPDCRLVVIRNRHHAALPVLYLDRHHRDVLAVGVDLAAIGWSTTLAAGPVVSRRNTRTRSPPLNPRASRVPGGHFTFQTRRVLAGAFCAPWL
jgi:hypothetical protein